MILLSFHIKFKNNCQKVIIVGMDISGSMVHLLIVLFDSDPMKVCVRQKNPLLFQPMLLFSCYSIVKVS